MPASSDLAIHAAGLTKRFAGHCAVDGVDLAVPAGCVYGFLGPNGAGKTTTVRMLATLLRPDAGQARVLGHDIVTHPGAVRERIALTGQFAAVDQDLTGAENLIVAARLLGHRPRAARERAEQLLSAFGLAEAGARPVKTYSGGMRRRLDIAASLIAMPELLFLDEPTTGLDPAARNQVWDIVRALAGAGTTVLLTTQYLAEADELAARVAVIDHGRLIAEGTPGELRAAGGTGVLHVRLADPARRADAAELLHRRLGPAEPADPTDPSRTGPAAPVGTGPAAPAGTDPAAWAGTDPAALTIAADPSRAAEALAELARAGIAVTGFSLDQPSLEEVFLALTSKAREAQGPASAAA